MSDQEKKQQTSVSPQTDAENKKQSPELSEEELKKVTGGAATAGSLPNETIQINYGSVEWTYSKQQP
jgi:bacteriocin-like protein